MEIEAFLDAYGLAAIFGVLLLKSVGVPIPIPADALMLAASARVASGSIALPAAFIALLVALTVGGVAQFGLVRGPGRGLLTRYGRYLGITPARLETASSKLRRGGVPSISLAILTPGVRSIAVVACGLAGIPLRLFVAGLFVGSSLFLALHFLLGYIGGSVLNTLSSVVPLPIILIGLIVLLLVGFWVWFIIRKRQLPDATSRELLAEAAGAWHEATCPVCLALGAANRLQIQLPVEHHH
ncbi:MAG: VTT domain-containing protein [Anaerolineae bacterium]|nr:VTT domain-containing protein [Anaerolineae bacterium]